MFLLVVDRSAANHEIILCVDTSVLSQYTANIA